MCLDVDSLQMVHSVPTNFTSSHSASPETGDRQKGYACQRMLSSVSEVHHSYLVFTSAWQQVKEWPHYNKETKVSLHIHTSSNHLPPSLPCQCIPYFIVLLSLLLPAYSHQPHLPLTSHLYKIIFMTRSLSSSHLFFYCSLSYPPSVRPGVLDNQILVLSHLFLLSISGSFLCGDAE